jgi:hypothetical protein
VVPTYQLAELTPGDSELTRSFMSRLNKHVHTKLATVEISQTTFPSLNLRPYYAIPTRSSNRKQYTRVPEVTRTAGRWPKATMSI